jgi:predicted enzyme related to lactoylglutathione lyase
MENIFCFVEIPVTDMKRAIEFYSNLLNIKLNLLTYAGSKMAFFPNENNIVSGALIEDKNYKTSSDGVLVYFNGGDDLNNILQLVEKFGGKILLNKTKVSENHF